MSYNGVSGVEFWDPISGASAPPGLGGVEIPERVSFDFRQPAAGSTSFGEAALPGDAIVSAAGFKVGESKRPTAAYSPSFGWRSRQHRLRIHNTSVRRTSFYYGAIYSSADVPANAALVGEATVAASGTAVPPTSQPATAAVAADATILAAAGVVRQDAAVATGGNTNMVANANFIVTAQALLQGDAQLGGQGTGGATGVGQDDRSGLIAIASRGPLGHT